MANGSGIPLVSIGNATVYHAGTDSDIAFAYKRDFYGNLVVLHMADTWNGHSIYALYGHLETIAVQTGQTVLPGQLLGTIGDTGVAYGPHLHFEIRVDDPTSYWDVRNPELWYKPLAGQGLLAGRAMDERGWFIPGQQINLTCGDGSKRYVETYWDQGTPPDDMMAENFAISDLPTGYCTVETEIDGQLIQESAEVVTGEISFVVLKPPRG